MKYGIEVNQIYVAADGSHNAHLVTDITTYDHCDDVVTTPFYLGKWQEPGNRIDSWKLAMVRYYLPDVLPEWLTIKENEL